MRLWELITDNMHKRKTETYSVYAELQIVVIDFMQGWLQKCLLIEALQ